MKEIWKEDTTNKWEESSKKKEEENQNIENKRYQITEKKEGKVELILCIACIVDEKKNGIAGGLVSLRKSGKAKFQETWKSNEKMNIVKWRGEK